jgi:hypothetical protein
MFTDKRSFIVEETAAEKEKPPFVIVIAIVAIQILYFVVSISFLLVDAISSSSVSQVQEIEKQNEKLDKLLKKLQV